MQAHVKRNVYEVFAQIEAGGPISHIGNLNAPGRDLARVYARRIYDEERWSEMWVVPREDIVVAHPDDSSPFDFAPSEGPASAVAEGASESAAAGSPATAPPLPSGGQADHSSAGAPGASSSASKRVPGPGRD